MNSEFQNFDLETSRVQFQNILNRVLTPGVREIRQQPQTINVLPNRSTSSIPSVPFTNNTPPVAANVLNTNQQQSQQSGSVNLGQQYNLLSSTDKAKLLFGGF
jgi:hypothetical protein